MNVKKFVVLAAVVSMAGVVWAAEMSLVPVFGLEGETVAVSAKDGNKITGWLPKEWVDNSDWAAVSATYGKLTDLPKAGVAGISIQVTKVEDGQLQLTTWTKPVFKKSVKYVIEGWLRSKDGSGIKVGVRQPEEPYEFFVEQTLDGTAEWKPFEFSFSLPDEKEAMVMFTKPEAGSVDLAGVTVHEAK